MAFFAEWYMYIKTKEVPDMHGTNIKKTKNKSWGWETLLNSRAKKGGKKKGDSLSG